MTDWSLQTAGTVPAVKYTPDDILDAAVDVVAAEGIGVSTSRIAKAAGVSNGTLFNYFPTKQDLLDAMYVHVKRQLAAAIGDVDPDGGLRDQARQVWERWIDWATEAPASWKVAHLLHGADLVSGSAVEEALVALHVPMRVLGEFERLGGLADLPVEYVGAVIQAQLDVAIELGLDPSRSTTAFDVMWNGIMRTSGTTHTTTLTTRS